MLFTAAFSLFIGMAQAAQESTMREVGTRCHAGLKEATVEQFEKISADQMVKKSDYNILLGIAENFQMRQTEIRYMPFEDALPDYFIDLLDGHMPKDENEIVVDTIVMDAQKAKHALGEKITLQFPFMGETIKKEFSVSGYYKGDSINHASQVFVSEEFWNALKGNLTAEDFKEWQKEHPEDAGIGLLSVNLSFSNAKNIEEKVREVISRAGYEPGTQLDYGVNWAYMGNRLESIDPFSYFLLAGAVGVILLTGYLIIYNIFQISIMNDIRFYGLLKTIGTTKKQLRRLIMRQVLLLSVIGIPLGLFFGFAVGTVGVSTMIGFMNYGNMDISLKPSFGIFLFSAVFSVVTVFISCRKPGRIAGSVSPVEAAKYTQVQVNAHSKGRKIRHFSPFTMACANLKRNKKRTCIIVGAISLSIILLTLVMTGVGSFRIEQYLEQRIAGDIMIGSANLFNTAGGSLEIDKDYVNLAKSQQGIEKENEMWVGFGIHIKNDATSREQLRKLDQEGKLDKQFGLESLESDTLPGDVFGYTDGLMENITVLEGKLDIENFQNGDYILLQRFHGTDMLESKDSLYHPGDKVTVTTITSQSTCQEIKDDSGETIDVVYDNLAEKEYKVMAIVDVPSSMGLGMYVYNGMHAILPLRELKDGVGMNNTCFARSYSVMDEKEEEFESALKGYIENTNPLMGYATKQSLEEEFSGMIGAIASIGIVLAGVIALIGIINFINAVFTSVISRKREFSMLQSIGMTKGQLLRVMICEGVSYVMISGILSIIFGSILAYVVLKALNNVILFFEYQFQAMSFFIMIPILLITAVLTPSISFWKLQKQSIVERLREAE